MFEYRRDAPGAGGSPARHLGVNAAGRLTCDVGDCRACPLGSGGLPRVHGYGPLDADVAVVGINPSVRATDGSFGAFLVPYLATFQRRGILPPSTLRRGAARAFWNLAIEAGLDLSRVYSTNVVKCATPSNRRPTPGEVNACVSRNFDEEMQRLPNLRTVLLFGRVAGAVAGLSDFGTSRTLEGTIAEATLLPHPIATLRRWTALDLRAGQIREVLPPVA